MQRNPSRLFLRILGAFLIGALQSFSFSYSLGILLSILSIALLMLLISASKSYCTLLLLCYYTSFISLQFKFLLYKTFSEDPAYVIILLILIIINYIPAAFYSLCVKNRKAEMTALGILFGEFIFSYLDFGNFFFITGFLVGDFWKVAQWLSILGIYYGSLWVFLCAWVLYRKLKGKKISPSVIVILILPLLLSLFLRNEKKGENYIAVASLNASWTEKDIRGITDNARKAGVDFLLFPEGMFDFDSSFVQFDPFITETQRICKDSEKMVIILGAFINSRLNRYNSVLVINRGGAMQRHKQILIPFSEYIPCESLLGNSTYIQNKMLYRITKPKSQKNVFSKDAGIRFSPVICYEATNLNFMLSLAKETDMFLVSSSNIFIDDMHMEQVAMKIIRCFAIISRKPFARATDNGVSFVISHSGEILANAVNKTTLLICKTDLQEKKSFYVNNKKQIDIAYLITLASLSCYLLSAKKKFYCCSFL